MSNATTPLEVNSSMKKWKEPPTLDFVNGAVKRFSFLNWQSGNDDSIYYNLNIPSFFKSRIVPPPESTSKLPRDIKPELLDLTFYQEYLEKETPALKEYLVGPKQVQAMLMMHKGKVVFETYPGMNPEDYHVWMSASKSCVSMIAVLLWEEGKLDFEKSPADYLKEFKGTAWENVRIHDVMNMSSGLDIEECFESLSNPKSWIVSWMTSIFEQGKGDWRDITLKAKPLPSGEKPNEVFRYSTANTQVLVLLVEQVTNMTYDQVFKKHIWSKIGAKSPFIIGLGPDNTPLGGGLNVTTPEDFLRYAAMYTPSHSVVTGGEKVVSDKALECLFKMGNPKIYGPSQERNYGMRWFGEYPHKNSAQWDHVFEDGAMFKHGNMGQGIYVDPKRDFCGVYFGLASNDETVTGPDLSPGYLRGAAKFFNGERELKQPSK